MALTDTQFFEAKQRPCRLCGGQKQATPACVVLTADQGPCRYYHLTCKHCKDIVGVFVKMSADEYEKEVLLAK